MNSETNEQSKGARGNVYLNGQIWRWLWDDYGVHAHRDDGNEKVLFSVVEVVGD